jgi:hypothetical protein
MDVDLALKANNPCILLSRQWETDGFADAIGEASI